MTVTQAPYRGWKDTYRISNGTVDLVVVPQIGRIMRYGYVRGRNLLWAEFTLLGQTTAADYGGDRLEITRFEHNSPAPTAAPPFRFEATQTRTGLLLVSEPDAAGIRYERRISLDASGTVVTIVNRGVNTSKNSLRLSLMQTAEVYDPDVTTLDLGGEGLKNGWHGFGTDTLDPAFHDIVGEKLLVRRSPGAFRRFGTAAATGVAACRRKNVTFTMSHRLEPGGFYPDAGVTQSVTTRPDPRRSVMLHMHGPVGTVPAGGVQEMVVRWDLRGQSEPIEPEDREGRSPLSETTARPCLPL